MATEDLTTCVFSLKCFSQDIGHLAEPTKRILERNFKGTGFSDFLKSIFTLFFPFPKVFASKALY